MSNSILVIGSSNVDFIMRVPRLPQRGETVTDGEFHQVFGGKGANQAVGAARAGGQVTFITCLGEDMYAPQILESFANDGINVGHVARAKGVATGTALVMFDDHGDNYLSVAPGANYRLTPAHVKEHEELVAEASVVLLQMELAVVTTRDVLRLAKRHGTRIIFNYAPVRQREVTVDGSMTGLVVNETEAAALVDETVRDDLDYVAVAQKLRQRGPEFVVLTLGAEGAVLATAEGSEKIPAFSVKPVDTTAAGDTFCGALAVAIDEGCDLPAAVRFANAAAALTVTRVGAQPSIPHRDEIDAFIAQHAGE